MINVVQVALCFSSLMTFHFSF